MHALLHWAKQIEVQKVTPEKSGFLIVKALHKQLVFLIFCHLHLLSNQFMARCLKFHALSFLSARDKKVEGALAVALTRW